MPPYRYDPNVQPPRGIKPTFDAGVSNTEIYLFLIFMLSMITMISLVLLTYEDVVLQWFTDLSHALPDMAIRQVAK